MANPADKLPPIQNDPHARRLVLIIGYMLVIAGAAYAVTVLWLAIATLIRVLSPFLVAFVVAYLFNPIVSFFQRRLRLSRVAGVLFVNLLILLVVGIFVGIIVPILYTQIGNAYREVRSFTMREVIPWATREFNLPLAASEPQPGDLLGAVEEWAAEHRDGLETGAQRAVIDQLIEITSTWIEEQPADNEEPEESLDTLHNRVTHMLQGYPGGEPPESVEQLRGIVDDWIGDRRAWLGKEPVHLEFRDFWNQISDWLERRGIRVEEMAQQAVAEGQVQTAATHGVTIVGGLFAAIGRGIGTIVTSVIFIVFVFLVSFYLLIDFAKLRGVAEIILPDKYEERFFSVLAKVDEAVGGFIRGQLFVATLVGILATIGLWFLGLKQYAVLIGIITGIGNLIPYLGPVMGAAPAVIYILVSESYDSIQERLIRLGLLIGLFGAIQFLEGFVFQPKIVGKGAQLHPVIVILALALGAPFGIMGMIIALPVAAAVRVLFKEFYWDARQARWHETTGKRRLDDVEPRPPRRDTENHAP